MAYDIRYAGLNERLYRHLLQTRHFMPRPVPKTRVAAWNGSDCDLLLADSRDHYGDLVIGKADTRGIPIVAVTRDTHP